MNDEKRMTDELDNALEWADRATVMIEGLTNPKEREYVEKKAPEFKHAPTLAAAVRSLREENTRLKTDLREYAEKICELRETLNRDLV